MKMVTTLAGKQLQKDLVKKRLSITSIREDLEGDAGELGNNFSYSFSFMTSKPVFTTEFLIQEYV